MIRHTANIITFTRIIFGVIMFWTAPFTMLFWVCYLGGGLSDILDGFAARKLNQQSAAGAKLDSAADLVFGAALAVTVIRNIPFPAWLWGWIGGIAAVRFTGYGIGAYRFHTFAALHTWANKIAGLLIFLFPFFCRVSGLEITGIILCVTASAASLEELIIIVRSGELNRDCRGLPDAVRHEKTGAERQ